MIEFEIEFVDSTTFNFIDNSDYTGVNVVDTNLSVYLPPIESTENFQTVALYSTTVSGLPVQTLGDDATIITTELASPFSLVDGTYRFLYNVILDDTTTVVTEINVIKDIDLQACKKLMVQALINSEEGEYCKACEATSFDAILNSAKYEASICNYIQATEMTEYLKSICNTCNC